MFVVVRTFHVCQITRRNIGTVIDKPLHTLLETWESIDRRWLQDQGSVKRHETNKTSYGKLHAVAWTKLDSVVVKAVLFVPEALLVIALPKRHGVCNKDKMLQDSL